MCPVGICGSIQGTGQSSALCRMKKRAVPWDWPPIRDSGNFTLMQLTETETLELLHPVKLRPFLHPGLAVVDIWPSLLIATVGSGHSLKTPFQDGPLDSHYELTAAATKGILSYTPARCPGTQAADRVKHCVTWGWEYSGFRGVPGNASSYSSRHKEGVPAGSG